MRKKLLHTYHVFKAEYHLLMANKLASLSKVDYHRQMARKSIVTCLYLLQFPR